mmetsp:Transcript_6011/g.17100  ORF Transcript_6011/g.17100 Transcript_6011/m.17100 type:complete len:183 (+) Transcript_6011:3409-3957(+)
MIGHGSRVRDYTGREQSGYNSTLVPIDFDRGGHIIDDELYEHLVCRMPKGTTLTCLMDCCHSGTVLDLPFNFVADGEQTEMVALEAFPFLRLLQLVGQVLREAGVRNVRDLRDRDKRQAALACVAKNAAGVLGGETGSVEQNLDELRRDIEGVNISGVRDAIQGNRRARQERRENRRERLFR